MLPESPKKILKFLDKLNELSDNNENENEKDYDDIKECV